MNRIDGKDIFYLHINSIHVAEDIGLKNIQYHMNEIFQRKSSKELNISLK